jgi:glycine betaine/proline transport system ATP-binding protein
MAAVQRESLSKEVLRGRFGCVIGVAGVSFSIRPREIFCVMGLSGSGKSTLIRHINRLIEPSSGEVIVGGRSVNLMTLTEMRRFRAETVGMVFQNMALFPHRTVLENVGFGLEVRNVPKAERHRAACDMLRLVKLEGWEARYPDELSGGMQQRVGLARALAADPDILLMDEPFSALDPLIRRELQDEFVKLSKVMKKTTVFITHDLEEAIRLGDRIAIMKDGRFVQVGRPAEIILAPADDYVARFVETVSPLPFLKARDIMRPVDRECPMEGDRTIDAGTSLHAVIEAATSTQEPLIVVESGRAVGMITKDIILDRVRLQNGRGRPAL